MTRKKEAQRFYSHIPEPDKELPVKQVSLLPVLRAYRKEKSVLNKDSQMTT